MPNGYQRVSNEYQHREGALNKLPGSLGRILFVIIPPHTLVVVEAKAIRSYSNFIEIKSTMTLHTSWNALFNLLTTVNETGNQNIAGVTGAMDFKTNPELKMAHLNQAYNIFLTANSTREVTILHKPYNFGGTLLCPTDKAGCLVGKGPSAFPVIINHQAALCSIQVTVPPFWDITNCLAADDLAAIPAPTTTRHGLSNLNKGLSSFSPHPSFALQYLQRTWPNPLALILAGKVAKEKHIREHDRDEGFDKGIVNAHVELFSL